MTLVTTPRGQMTRAQAEKWRAELLQDAQKWAARHNLSTTRELIARAREYGPVPDRLAEYLELVAAQRIQPILWIARLVYRPRRDPDSETATVFACVVEGLGEGDAKQHARRVFTETTSREAPYGGSWVMKVAKLPTDALTHRAVVSLRATPYIDAEALADYTPSPVPARFARKR